MTLEQLMSLGHLMIAVIGLAGGAVSIFVSLQVKIEVARVNNELAKLRTERAEQAVKDLERAITEARDNRAWINGSFMRSKEVDAKIDGLKNQIEELQNHVMKANN